MAVTNYFTANGEIIGEETGGTQTDYLTDALGSVTATVDQNAAVVNTYRYKPYGAQLAKTGAGADPSFRWIGARGYRQTGKEFSEAYVRARHYGTPTGVWTTKDRGRDRRIAPYSYVRGRVVTYVDKSGLDVIFPDDSCGDQLKDIGKCCQGINELFPNGKLPDKSVVDIGECLKEKGFPVDKSFVRSALEFMKRMCSKEGGPKSSVCVICLQGVTLPPGCDDPCRGGRAGAAAIYPVSPLSEFYIRSPFPESYGCVIKTGDPGNPCAPLHDPTECACTILFCTTAYTSVQLCQILIHELIHCGGIGGPPGHNEAKEQKDLISALACCICEAIYGKGDSGCYNCGYWPPVGP
ncbi:MAG: hypothetical protein IH851_08170 [Armatimonadetes bacterium]|nr:hypothetical protein [Armatimonadota bacterium]